MTTNDPLFSNLFPPPLRSWRARVRRNLPIFGLGATLLALVTMGWSYTATLRSVTLQINHQARTIRSNQTTVAGVLHDAALVLAPEDLVFPALDAPVPTNQSITIQLAQPVAIQADGGTVTRRTQSKTVGDVLRESSVFIKPGDRVFMDGTQVEAVAPFVPLADTAMPQIVVQRAIPIQLNDNGALTTLYTTAPTLGEALRQAGLVVYLGDAVAPDLGTPVTPGYQVFIRRSRAATINVDGRTIRTRTLGATVTDALAGEGIRLENKDYATPAATESLRDGMQITVMRVREDLITESEYIPFETSYQPDSALDIDLRANAQVGVVGVKKRTIRVLYENGREVKRSVDKEWIDATPVTQIINYGTRITKQSLTLPNGQALDYWRKIRILATSYTAASSGKARTHPEFGITYLGLQAGTGIVAVDPKVINLRSVLYIPGYGLGLAGDTGGRIKGRRVDLGYNEADLVLWYKWVDTYQLWPPPPADQIHWLLPDTPKELTTKR